MTFIIKIWRLNHVWNNWILIKKSEVEKIQHFKMIVTKQPKTIYKFSWLLRISPWKSVTYIDRLFSFLTMLYFLLYTLLYIARSNLSRMNPVMNLILLIKNVLLNRDWSNWSKQLDWVGSHPLKFNRNKD